MALPPAVDGHAVRFLAVGLFNTAVGLGVIFAAKRWLGLGDVAANALGYGVGLAVSFLLNRRWTFRFDGDGRAALGRYLLTFLVSYGANLATVLFLVRALHVDGYWAQTVGIVPYTVLFYLGSRYFVFVPPRH